MAWSWTHTGEAYADAYENVKDLPRDTLVEILAEWHARDAAIENGTLDTTGDPFDPIAFEDERARLAVGIPTVEILADAVWELASEQQTCDNGGFNAWLCPYGCGCHTVAFDRERGTMPV